MNLRPIRLAVVLVLCAAALIWSAVDAGAQVVDQPQPPEPSAAPDRDPAPDSLVDSMIQGPGLQGNQAPTVAERYGMTDYRYPFYGQGVSLGAQADEAWDQGMNGVASVVLLMAAALIRGATALLQWAFDTRTTAWLLDAVEGVVEIMATSTLGQFAVIAVMAGVGWAGWRLIVHQRGSQAMGGIVWIVAVLAIGIAFVNNPRGFVETPQGYATEFQGSLFSGIAGVATPSGGDYYGRTAPSFGGPAPVDVQRRIQDQIWRVAIHEPWRYTVFPSLEIADEYGEVLLADRSDENVQQIWEAIGRDDERAAEVFAGRESSDRMFGATMTFLAAIPIAVTISVLAVSLIVLTYAFVILTMLAALFLLIGIHPGSGRDALAGWFDMWFGVLVKQVMITALLAALITALTFAAANVGLQGWFFTVTIYTGLCITLLIFRKPLQNLLASGFGPAGGGDESGREYQQRSRPAAAAAKAGRTVRNVAAAGFAVRALRGRDGRPDNDRPEGSRPEGSRPTPRRQGAGHLPAGGAPASPSPRRTETSAQWADRQRASIPPGEAARDGERQAAKHMSNGRRRPAFDPAVRTGSTSERDRRRRRTQADVIASTDLSRPDRDPAGAPVWHLRERPAPEPAGARPTPRRTS